jgi:hypothetical protein
LSNWVESIGNGLTRWPRRAALVAVAAIALAAAAPAGAAESKGTDFWLTFPGNIGFPDLSLFITGDTATTGTVTIAGLSFTAPFSVTPGAVTTVPLPTTASLNLSDTVEDRGIHVTAAAEVTVDGLSHLPFSTDGYLGLPTDALGTEYIALGYRNADVTNGTQLGLVATRDATAVTITPTETTNGHAAGLPYTVNLGQGQTYLLRSTNAAPADLSGTVIQSSRPVAVFGGHQCANIPAGFTACDHLVEQLPPTAVWGEDFVSMPLATRTGGDTFRVVASQAGTTVQLNGATVATIGRGQFYEQVVSGPAQIAVDKPVLVMQYSNSSSFDGAVADPFQMMVPPSEQFLSSYTVATPPSGFALDFVNVVAPVAGVGATTLDGIPIPAASFTPIGASGFSGAQVPVTPGAHTLSGPLPFGVHSYGFDAFDGYGYPGGLSMPDLPLVASSVALAPKTATNPVGTEHCVTATVEDQYGDALEGIDVDFAVTGANPSTGSAMTSTEGEAGFCYLGANAGTDTITATVGALSDTATKTWRTPASTPRPLKRKVRDDLIALAAGVTDPDDAHRLAEAIQKVQESLADSLWVDDSHVVSPQGENVFEKERRAVDKLREIVRDPSSTVDKPAVQSAIEQLASVDRQLATIAIADASGGDPGKLAEANREVAKADSELAKGKPGEAIDHYRRAWKKALEARR